MSESSLRVVIGVELEAAQLQRIRDSFRNAEIVYVPDKDGLRDALSCADVLFGSLPRERLTELLPVAPRLRWIQTYSAGVNSVAFAALAERSILLTNASGAHGIQIAENILALMLGFAIRLPALVRAQAKREWIAREVDAEKFDLDGQTLLIAGLGGIGGALAKKAAALGLYVIGIRRRPASPPEGVREMITAADLHAALGRADHVALCLPLTPETTDYLGEPQLRAMKPSGYVYNVGRGKSINRDALLLALREGWIAGAGLDVSDPEPLPQDDPLWERPNVVLTQHTSGGSPALDRRVTDIFIDNLRRFIDGSPLNNQVDYERQY